MVSVVILSFNTRAVTLKCLETLLTAVKRLEKEVKVKTEVLVIDNASSDGSAEAIKNNFPQVKLVVNKVNNGFARGQNQGIKAAKGEDILMLNSDAYVKEDTLVNLYEFAKNNPSADLVGSKLLNPDGGIQQSFGYFPTPLRIILFMFFIDNFPVMRKKFKSIHIRDKSRYEQVQEVDWVMGACVWLKKEVFNKTGGLDEKYFMYGEEAEWMYRVKKAGYKIWYFPGAEVVHLGRASTGSLGKAISGEMKGYIYWYAKHNPVWEQKLLPLILIKGCLFKTIVWGIFGKKDMAIAHLEAMKEIWRATFGKTK